MLDNPHFSSDSNPLPAGTIALQQALPLFVGCSLALVAHRATGAQFSMPGVALLLCGIGAAYSFDRLVDAGRSFSPPWLKRILAGVFVACSLAVLVISFFMPREIFIGTAFLGFICLLYTRFKRLPLAKTILVTLGWTWACLVIPLSVSEQIATRWWSLTITPPLVMFVAAGCILCDLKDVEEDRSNSIMTLPVLTGRRFTCLIAALLSAFAAIIAAVESRYGLVAGAAMLLIASRFPKFLSTNPYGVVTVDAALALPGALILMGIL